MIPYRRCTAFVALLFLCGVIAMPLKAQESTAQGGKPRPNQQNQGGPGGAPAGGPGGQGFPGGPPGGGPPGGPMMQELELVKEFDKDADGRLNTQERRAARESARNQRGGRGPGGRGPERTTVKIWADTTVTGVGTCPAIDDHGGSFTAIR